MLEMKVRLLRQLSAASRVKSPSALQGPPQAHQFISLLLEEYGALCQAARTISTFLGTLVSRLRPLPGAGVWRPVTPLPSSEMCRRGWGPDSSPLSLPSGLGCWMKAEILLGDLGSWGHGVGTV